MNQTWIRFELANGEVMVGAVDVPKAIPSWFQPELEKLNAARGGRLLEMTDISALEWLEYHLTSARPIPVFRPLSPRFVPEPVFVAMEDLEKAKKELPPGDAPKGAIRLDPSKTKIYFLAEIEKMKPETQQKMVGLRAEQLGIQAPVRITYDPIVSGREVEGSFRLNPRAVTSYVQIRDEEGISKQARKVYNPEACADGSCAPPSVLQT